MLKRLKAALRKKMIEITLLRHSKIDGPAALYGKTDVAALPHKDEEIITTLSQLKPFYDLVVSSPLKRCFDVAQQLSQYTVSPLECDNSFQEMNFGDLDGVAFEQLVGEGALLPNAQHYWALLEKFWQHPAESTLPLAETLFEFNQRVLLGWQKLIAKLLEQALQKEQTKQRVLLVCHGGVIRMILAHVLNLDWQNPTWYQGLSINNASLSQLLITPTDTEKPQHMLSQITWHSKVEFIGLPISAVTYLS